MTCCIHSTEERLRADRIERKASADFNTAVDAVTKLQSRIAELEALLTTALALHGGEAHTHSEKEWRTAARAVLGFQKPEK